MPCNILPTNIVGNAQVPGKSISPRGDWSGRFFGVPQCVKNPINPLNDRAWDAIENNIIVGNPQVQNIWPPFAQRPYGGLPPIPLGNAGPSLEIGGWVGPGPAVLAFLPDSALMMNLFVDECTLNTAYPVAEWSVTGPFPPGSDGCTYAFVVIAPQGTPTMIGRGGSTVLNYCPTIIAETGNVGVSGIGGDWRSCIYTVPNLGTTPPATITYNLCPTTPGYTPCTGSPPGTPPGAPIGQIASIAALDITSAGTFTWMRNQFFETQVHYLIPSILNPNTHLYVASKIETKQVM